MGTRSPQRGWAAKFNGKWTSSGEAEVQESQRRWTVKMSTNT